MGSYGHVLATTDLSEVANAAALRAARLARDLQADLTLLHVIEELPVRGSCLPGYSSEEALERMREQATEALEQLRREAAPNVGHADPGPAAILAHGHPVDCILATAREVGADLVVVAAHTREEAAPFWFGDVAQRVARLCDVSVLILR